MHDLQRLSCDGSLARVSLAAFLACVAMVPLSMPAAAQQQAALPNGASALRESYQDWQLYCTIRDRRRACSVSQDQTQQNGQRLLAVEIGARPDGAFATLLLPFGILFEQGVTPQIDNQAPLAPLRFRTCLPTGCVALFPIDRAVLARLRAGSSLRLTVTTAASTPLTFPVSLKGLAAALARLDAINRS
jgi:invasion protein IalB